MIILTSSVLVLSEKLSSGCLSLLNLTCSPSVKTRRTFFPSRLSPPSLVNNSVAALCRAISERVPHLPGNNLTFALIRFLRASSLQYSCMLKTFWIVAKRLNVIKLQWFPSAETGYLSINLPTRLFSVSRRFLVILLEVSAIIAISSFSGQSEPTAKKKKDQ